MSDDEKRSDQGNDASGDGENRQRARSRNRRRSRDRGGNGSGSNSDGVDGSSKDDAKQGGSDQGGGGKSQGGGRKRRNKRRRGRRRGNRNKNKGVGFWGDVEKLPEPDTTVRITDDPAAVPRSLGHPPLPGHERIAQNYFELVYTRAATTAGAVAAAGGLIEPDELVEEFVYEDDPDDED